MNITNRNNNLLFFLIILLSTPLFARIESEGADVATISHPETSIAKPDQAFISPAETTQEKILASATDIDAQQIDTQDIGTQDIDAQKIDMQEIDAQEADNNEPEHDSYSPEIHTTLDAILRQEISVINSLDRMIEGFLLSIRSGSLTVANKKEFKKNADTIRAIIAGVKSNTFLEIDLRYILAVSDLNRGIIDHLQEALKTNLSSLPAFDVEAHMTRSRKTEITLDTFVTNAQENLKLLEILEREAEVAGLTVWNKRYRKFNELVIKPALKYNAPHYTGLALKTAGAIAIAAYTLRNVIGLTPENTPRPLSSWLRWAGERPELTGVNVIANGTQVKALGLFDSVLRDFTRGDMCLATAASALVKGPFQKEYIRLHGFLTRKVAQFHNRAMGGAYASKQAEKDELDNIKPRALFSDLVGLDYAKEVLSDIVMYLENPERFDSRKVAPRKGYLLTGPTRTGKSFVVEALAGEIKAMYKRTGKNIKDFNFFTVPAELIAADGIRVLIDRAKSYAPCILFIDEIDLLGLQRAGGNSNQLSQFLESMSGALQSDPDKVVIMMAATNRPENLDEALRQDGRYGKEIRFEYPSFKHRKQYLTRKIGAITNLDLFDIDTLAYQTEGRSYESLNSLINNASYKAIINNQSLSQELLQMTLDTEIRNIIIKDQLNLSGEEQRIIATHQAGHALAMLLLEAKEKIAQVTIRPYLTELKEKFIWDQHEEQKKDVSKKIVYGKLFTYHEHDTRNIVSYEEQIKQCKIVLAGHVAEIVMYGKSGYSYHREDVQSGFDLAKLLAAKGLDISQLSDTLKSKYLQKALILKKQCEIEMRELFEHNKEALKKIIDALCEQKSLSGKEVAAIAGVAHYGAPTHAAEIGTSFMQELGDHEHAHNTIDE